MPVLQRIQHRRDDSLRWAEVNPILASGEIGYETDTRNFKFGDGVSGWNSLPYSTAPSGGSGGDFELELLNHITSITPHPTYDDIPSLTVLFENGLF